jgi:NAD(P)-dependent dehydrogenase (short-subunit alcohol dehydrogenase family)
MSAEAGRNESTRAIVTGGAQGIGFAVANRLADEGCAAVALVGRSRDKGEAAAEALKQRGVDAIFISADLADTAACGAVVAGALSHFGSVNALVNAAASSARGSLTETTPELFDFIFNTNVRGPFFLMQGLVRHLLETKKPGAIVNVLSMSAHCGQSFLAPYSASKAALATLTKNAANAYRANRIRVNAVLPGWMDTPGEAVVQAKFHGAGADWLEKAEAAQPMGQLVKPDQLAGLVAYMISPHSGVMTGALVDYDQNIAGAFPE